VIHGRALEIVDAEGVQGLNARRLAAELKISTRTLYKRIGSRDKLIHAVVGLHFSQITLGLREYDSWESTAFNWCHETLLAHPHITLLMTDDHAKFLLDYADEFVKMTVQEGVPRALAIECCRSLINLTINDAIVEVRALDFLDLHPRSVAAGSPIDRNFPETVKWILVGVRAGSPGHASADLR
jgi:AcrR family transcriptional regulator